MRRTLAAVLAVLAVLSACGAEAMTKDEFAGAILDYSRESSTRNEAIIRTSGSGDFAAAIQLSKDALEWMDSQDAVFARPVADCLAEAAEIMREGLALKRETFERTAQGDFDYAYIESPGYQEMMLSLNAMLDGAVTEASEIVLACP